MSELPDNIERFFVHPEPDKTGDKLRFKIICPYEKEEKGGLAPRICTDWYVDWSMRGAELDRMDEADIATMREYYVAELKKKIRRALREQNSHLEIRDERPRLIPNESED